MADATPFQRTPNPQLWVPGDAPAVGDSLYDTQGLQEVAPDLYAFAATDPVSQELELKRALAQYLHDQGAGIYKTVGSYLPAERGIFTNGPDLPTTLDNCIVLTSRRPIPDGRSNLIFPIDILSRVKGNRIAAGNLAGFIFDVLDHQPDVPPGLHISWAWETSRLDYSADANGRTASIQTFYFRGRRRGA